MKISKKILKIIFSFITVIIIYGLYLLIEKQNTSWHETKKLNTVDSYNEYIRIYPQGRYYIESGKLIEESTWRNTVKLNTINSYSSYIKAYLNGKYIAESKKQLEELIWLESKEINTEESYSNYIEKYAQGNYFLKAVELLENLVWNKSKKLNTAKSYERYLKLYSQGKYYKKGTNLREQIIWNKSKKLNTIKSYNSYLNTTFTGKYKKTAHSRIMKISDSKKRAESKRKKIAEDRRIEQKRKKVAEKNEKRKRLAKKKKKNLEIMNAIKMTYVKGGEFQMGLNQKKDEYFNKVRPVFTAALSSFYFAKFEISEKEWKAVMGATPSKSKGDNYPVATEHKKAKLFIKKINQKTGKKYRLPTEAEWEFVVRNLNDLDVSNMTDSFGEWCSDYFSNDNDKYFRGRGRIVNPKGPSSGEMNIIRGVLWYEGNFENGWGVGSDSAVSGIRLVLPI